jgi:endonuclease-3|mmetsp:Transcript_86093/g.135177  ORF Transcript_86093/g.135177 Transcript_86093/m.135177 type:complete len:320 (+) Transcript_86093:53-1012(+)
MALHVSRSRKDLKKSHGKAATKRKQVSRLNLIKGKAHAKVLGARTLGSGIMKVPGLKRSRKPPAVWQKDYAIIQELRAKRDAPVDTVGCERLADPKASRKNYEWQCLVAAMLSSQTKDQANAEAMAALHQHGNTIDSMAAINVKQLDRLISKVGFHSVKAKNIKAAAKICRDQFQGRVPSTLEGLLALPGVGPKMAHLTLHAAFDAQQGLCIDTHIHRIANDLGWIRTRTPEDTRKAIEHWLPQEYWPDFNVILVGFGQQQQQQQQLIVERCLQSSSPLMALKLLARLGMPLRAARHPKLAETAQTNPAIRQLLRRNLS